MSRRIGQNVHEPLAGIQAQLAHDRRFAEIGVDQQHFQIALARQSDGEVERTKGLPLVRMRRTHQHPARLRASLRLRSRQNLTLNDAKFFEQRRCAAVGIDQAVLPQQRPHHFVFATGERYGRSFRLYRRYHRRRTNIHRLRRLADPVGCAPLGRLCYRLGGRLRLALWCKLLRLLPVKLARHGCRNESIQTECTAGAFEQRCAFLLTRVFLGRYDIRWLVH